MQNANLWDLLRSTNSYPHQQLNNIHYQLDHFLNQNKAPLRADIQMHPEQRQNLIRLKGIVPIVHGKNQYRIPIQIWITKGFPYEPPECWVVPTPVMDISRDHKHVDDRGKVYCNYLKQWNIQHSFLQGLFHEMSGIFSAKSPVFSKVNKQIANKMLAKSRQTPQYRNSGHGQTPVNNMSKSYNRPHYGANQKQLLIAQILSKYEQECLKYDHSIREQTSIKSNLENSFSKHEQQKKVVDEKLKSILKDKEHLQSEYDKLSSLLVASRERMDNMGENIDDLYSFQNAYDNLCSTSQSEIRAYDDLLIQLEEYLDDGEINFDLFQQQVRDSYKAQFRKMAIIKKITEKKKYEMGAHQQGLPYSS